MLCLVFGKLLLNLDQELRHQVNILEEYPMAFFVAYLEFVHDDRFGTLTKGNRMKLLYRVHSLGFGEESDIFERVGTW